MHTLCSSTSAIPLISENRRRLMQYTHKDTCNNQTLPHPTTSLGTLTHKTPPQHTLAGNSWTTSDLLVMNIVLVLLDTPLYSDWLRTGRSGDRIPVGGEIFRTCPDRPWGPSSLLYNGYRVFPWGKNGRGVTLTPHPLLVLWSWKSRAIPLLPLWAVRPVQSLSACTRVRFTLPYLYG